MMMTTPRDVLMPKQSKKKTSALEVKAQVHQCLHVGCGWVEWGAMIKGTGETLVEDTNDACAGHAGSGILRGHHKNSWRSRNAVDDNGLGTDCTGSCLDSNAVKAIASRRVLGRTRRVEL